MLLKVTGTVKLQQANPAGGRICPHVLCLKKHLLHVKCLLTGTSPSTGWYCSLDSASPLPGKRAGYKLRIPGLGTTLGFIWEINLLPGSLLDPSCSHSSSVDIFSNKQWISSMGQETSLCKWHYLNLHFQLLIFHFPSYKCFQKRRKAAAHSPGNKTTKCDTSLS